MVVSSCLKPCMLSFSITLNQKLPDFQAGFRNGRGNRDQIANIHWIIEKAREFQKNIYLCFIDYTLIVWIMTNCGKLLKRWKALKKPDHLTCFRNLYAGEEAVVRTQYGTTDWFKVEKRV